MKEYVFYSSKTGLKLMLGKKEKSIKNIKKYFKVITLSFFKIEKNTKPINFVLSPEEAYFMSIKLKNLLNKDVSKNRYDESVFIHKYNINNNEIKSVLTLSKFKHKDKIFYSIKLKRDNIDIVVPLSDRSILFLSSLLDKLSYEAIDVYIKKNDDITSDINDIIKDDDTVSIDDNLDISDSDNSSDVSDNTDDLDINFDLDSNLKIDDDFINF